MKYLLIFHHIEHSISIIHMQIFRIFHLHIPIHIHHPIWVCACVCVCLCQRWEIGHKKICLAGTWPKNVLLCHSNILSNENVAFMKLDKFADNLRNGTPNNRSNQTNVTMVFFSILFDIFNLFVFRFYVVYTQSV